MGPVDDLLRTLAQACPSGAGAGQKEHMLGALTALHERAHAANERLCAAGARRAADEQGPRSVRRNDGVSSGRLWRICGPHR